MIHEQAAFQSFSAHHDLSAREKEVFRMLLDGKTNGEIAGTLFITENTVKFHVRNVLMKTGSQSRLDLQKKFSMTLYPEIMQTEPEKGKIIRIM